MKEGRAKHIARNVMAPLDSNIPNLLNFRELDIRS